MVDKLIPGQWYDDSDGDRLLAITENDAVCEGAIFMHTFRDDDIAKLTHRPDCDGWDWQPPKPLKVEVGKTYRCRDGSTVKIIGDSPYKDYPFVAENGFTYMPSGRWHLGGKSARDLIEEIPEPEEPPLQVEVGKTYRCRDGSTVKIVDKSNRAGPNWPWDGDNTKTYNDNGRQFGQHEQSPFDLIEEIPEPDYIDIHKASGLNVGDTVRIVEKTEPKGWDACWTPGMNAEIGKVGAVVSDELKSGFRVKTDSSYDWYYPVTSLAKVEPKWRPFANLDEAEPFFDERLRVKSTGAIVRISGISQANLCIGLESYPYSEAFDEFELLDGTPFGIKVLE